MKRSSIQVTLIEVKNRSIQVRPELGASILIGNSKYPKDDTGNLKRLYLTVCYLVEHITKLQHSV
jgi:hypothetical protein